MQAEVCLGQRTGLSPTKDDKRMSVGPTTVFVDWERPEADELRPDAEAMDEESVLSAAER